MKKHIIKLGVVGVALVPFLASAQSFLSIVYSLTQQFGQIISILIPIVFGMAILAFFYGIFLYIFSQSSDSKKEGKGIMLWSLVAIFVMASVFGIIQLAQSTLGVSSGQGSFPTPRVN